MNLYLLKSSEGIEYDTYDSAVVCSDSAHDASYIHPNSNGGDVPEKWWENEDSIWQWDSPENLKVKFLGEAKSSLKRGVVCASYNAG